MSDQFVTVETFRSLPEAEATKLHLETEGLTVFLANAETIAMDWLLANAIGNIKLQVPSSQAATATALLEQIRRERRERKERGYTDADICLACGAPLPEGTSRCAACGWSYAGTGDAEPEIPTSERD